MQKVYSMTDESNTAFNLPSCPYCGVIPPHDYIGQCPNVLRVEYFQNGTIKSVEKK